MRKSWLLALCVAGAAALGPPARAADHRDGPRVLMDPSTDINDVFAWMSADGMKVYLAMTVFPAADAMSRFSNTAKYVFHLTSAPAYGMPGMTTRIICTFDMMQRASCWAGDGIHISGDASAPGGIANTAGSFKVFAGLREDPFFFNLDGFNAVRSAVIAAAPMLTFNMAGCPALDMPTSNALVGQLSSNPMMGMPVQDFFAGLNTLAIVVSIDKSLVTAGGPILGVWGSTNQ